MRPQPSISSLATVIKGQHGPAPEDSCQLHSLPGERLCTPLWIGAVGTEPSDSRLLLEVCPRHLTTSSLGTILVNASSIAEEAEHPKLRLWRGFNITLNRGKKKKKKKKKSHCAWTFIREYKSACLQAPTGPSALKSMEICCDWQRASGMPGKKSRDLVRSQGRNVHLSQHRGLGESRPGGYTARHGGFVPVGLLV